MLLLNEKGHIRSLWKISYPLMLAAFSGTFMHFIIRIVLAKYDTNAMIAVSSLANIIYLFQFSALSIAMIAEVFVGHFNGAGRFEDVSKPVWQMIWFAAFSGLFMIPIGFYGSELFIPKDLYAHGAPYFKYVMYFGVFYPLVGALSAFFVGQGKVKPVMVSIIIANLINGILTVPFVFGFANIVPEMGTKGAAISSGIAEMCAAVFLFKLFLSKENRQKYFTHRYTFNLKLFVSCFKIGFPNTLGHMSSYAAWAAIMIILAEKSIDHAMVMSIALTLWMLFSFVTEGMQKGVTACASNAMGAKKYDKVSLVLKSGLKLQFYIALVLAFPLVIMPGYLVDLFLPLHSDISSTSHLREIIVICCRWLWLAYIFDGMAWIIDGLLTAYGDTVFIMFTNAIGTWLFCVIPIYYFIYLGNGSAIQTLYIITGFCMLLCLTYYARFSIVQSKNVENQFAFKKHALMNG